MRLLTWVSNLTDSLTLRIIGLLLVVVIVHVIIAHTMTPDWPYDQPVIYPLLITYQYTVIPLACTVLLLFAVVALRVLSSQQFANQWIAILFGFLGTILFCVMNSGFGVLQAIVFLVLVGIVVAMKERALGISFALITLSLILVLIPLFQSFLNKVEHRETVQFNALIYHLAMGTSANNDLECEDHSLLVYQCDSSGIICHSVFRRNTYSICLGQPYGEVPTYSDLVADPAANTLQLRLDDEVIDIPVD